MSAMIDTMIYTGTVPWHGLGTHFDKPPANAKETITAAKLDWEVGTLPLKTDLHETIQNYHAVYRKDTFRPIGIVNKQYPETVQNVNAFNAFDSIIGKAVSVETAASLDGGKNVFGCFKINESYQLQDDTMDHYLVVFNDHLKQDGKVTVINTPVRVVCQNTLSAALSNNLLKYRIGCTDDTAVNSSFAEHILNSAEISKKSLIKQSEKYLQKKVTKEDVEKMLDELFPYIQTTGESMHDRANDAVSLMRETFLDKCMAVDNLQNYRGTSWQVINALADWDGHYTKSSADGIDLEKRMQTLPGYGNMYRTSKYLKMIA